MLVRGIYYIEGSQVLKGDILFEGTDRGRLTRNQCQKRIQSFHETVRNTVGFEKILEVSVISNDILGYKLVDEFFLKIFNIPFENVFYSSHVFENGGPYKELLTEAVVNPYSEPCLNRSGELKYYNYNGERWEISESLAFYDYIYCKAIKESLTENDFEMLLQYDAFSDAKFEARKSLNVHARRAAFVQLILKKFGKIPDMTKEEFCKLHEAICAR